MLRVSIVVIGCLMLAFFTGCQEVKKMTGQAPAMSMEDMTRPTQPVQMKQLEPFIGTWEGTAEMVPPAGSPAATQPAKTFKGGGVSEWTLDGRAMKSTGWHEMPDGQRATYIEYVMWDADEKKFRSVYLSDWGDFGTGWMWPSADGQTFHFTGRGTNAKGQHSSMSGSSTVVDANTMKWNFTEHGPMGRMEMRGTSTRTAESKTMDTK